MSLKRCLFAAALTLSLTTLAQAQNSFANRTTGGGVGGSQQRIGGSQTAMAGLSQTGQLSSAAAVNRTGFVGGGNQTGAGGARGGVGGVGGIGGLGGLGGLGGGFGGGFGGGGFGGGGFGGRGGGGFGRGGGFNQGGMNGGGQFGGQGGNQQQRSIRAGIKLGFAYKAPVSRIAAKFEQRLTKIPSFSKNARVRVSVVADAVVLSGTVPSEQDKKFAERLAMLEPGIKKVQNNLTVVALPPRPDGT